MASEPSTIWVCLACGKTSPTKRPGGHEGVAGWDVSCMLNSVRARNDETLIRGENGRVTHCEPPIGETDGE